MRHVALSYAKYIKPTEFSGTAQSLIFLPGIRCCSFCPIHAKGYSYSRSVTSREFIKPQRDYAQIPHSAVHKLMECKKSTLRASTRTGTRAVNSGARFQDTMRRKSPSPGPLNIPWRLSLFGCFFSPSQRTQVLGRPSPSFLS